jgi:hypothetical protein
MTVILWGKNITPMRRDVEIAILCHRDIVLERSTWEQNQKEFGEISLWFRTIVGLCLAGF